MKNEIYLIKGLNSKFTPAFDSDLELAKQLKVGEAYKFAFSKPRNYKFHKKFFALLNLVYNNQENYTNFEDLREDLTILAGYSEQKINYFTGEVTLKAKSISFASMDEVEFGKLYSAMLDTIIRVTGWEGSHLEEMVAEFM